MVQIHSSWCRSTPHRADSLLMVYIHSSWCRSTPHGANSLLMVQIHSSWCRFTPHGADSLLMVQIHSSWCRSTPPHSTQHIAQSLGASPGRHMTMTEAPTAPPSSSSRTMNVGMHLLPPPTGTDCPRISLILATRDSSRWKSTLLLASMRLAKYPFPG